MWISPAQQNIELHLPSKQPAVTFESITFSDGTTIETDPTDVVVLVGPNNAGKSLALRELETPIRTGRDTTVVASAKWRFDGTEESFEEFVRANTLIRANGRRGLTIQGYRLSVGVSLSDLKGLWPGQVHDFWPLFCLRIPTESRITGSNATNSIDTLTETPSHPIHLLYDDEVEKRVSDYFRQAFGEDLILYRAGGAQAICWSVSG